MRLRIRAVLVASSVVFAAVLFAQASAQTSLAFEVVSIKPNRSGAQEHSARVQPGGRFTAINMPVSSLIASAYGPNGLLLRRNQIEGGPDWIRVDGFDIDARAPAGADLDAGGTPSDPGIQAMLRALLADRFKLAAHMEHRTVSTYALKVARADGRLGPSMHPVQIDDCAGTRTLAANARQGGPSVWDTRQVCVVAVGGGGTSLTSYGGTMAQLANVLGIMVDRPVVDATGLSGKFEMNASFESARLGPDGSTGISVFTALREQLGLQLDGDKQDIDVLVIDHVDQPTPD
jgi:uncharacterized protein (TIGR03435 family)